MGRYGHDYRMGQPGHGQGQSEGYDFDYQPQRGSRVSRGDYSRGDFDSPNHGWQGTGWGGGAWADQYGSTGRYGSPGDHERPQYRRPEYRGDFGRYGQEEIPNWGGGFGWMNRPRGGYPSENGYESGPRGWKRQGGSRPDYGRDYGRGRPRRYGW